MTLTFTARREGQDLLWDVSAPAVCSHGKLSSLAQWPDKTLKVQEGTIHTHQAHRAPGASPLARQETAQANPTRHGSWDHRTRTIKAEAAGTDRPETHAEA